MTIRLTISDRVTFRVDGTIAAEDGRRVPFDFQLTAERVDAETLRNEHAREGGLISDFLRPRVTAWRGVLDADGKEAEFSPQAFDALLAQPGIAAVVYFAYVEAVSAKGRGKN